MQDRELLELAAQAAGIKLWWRGGKAICNETGYWNPLADDGDALRLAVRLHLRIYQMPGHGDNCVVACADRIKGISQPWASESLGTDPYAATRRAIVRAAAEMSSAIPLKTSKSPGKSAEIIKTCGTDNRASD